MEDNLKEEIESAILDFEIVRVVRSVKITSHESLSEHFTLTYAKKGKNDIRGEKKNLCYISLPPMPRITQRSLKVFDESGKELPIIPSHEIHDVLKTLSNEYLDRIRSDSEETKKLRPYFTQIFEYGDVEKKITEAEEILKKIYDQKRPQDKERETVLTLLGLISNQRYYCPFIELKNRLDLEEHQVIRYTIERPIGLEKEPRRELRKKIGKKLSFLIGYMKHEFGLKLPSTKSFHLEIIPPEGVEISDFEFEDLENSMVVENKRKKENYSSKKLLYISFSPTEINEIQKPCKDETGREKTPSVVLKMKINPLMRSLYFLFQVAILSPLLVRALNHSSSSFGPQNVFTSLALAATLFLSASVYTIDRPTVRKFALYQLVTALFLLLVELIVLVWFAEIAIFFFAAAFISLLAILVIVEFVLGIDRQK